MTPANKKYFNSPLGQQLISQIKQNAEWNIADLERQLKEANLAIVEEKKNKK